MSDVWITVVLLAVTAAIIRAGGPMAMGGRNLGRRGDAVIGLLAPALLAALIVVQTVGGEDGLEVDERVAGVAAAGALLVWRRDAMLPAVAIAALVTAGLRALG